MHKLVTIILTIVLTTSCATLFSKNEDTVKFVTTPEGATVYLDGEVIGTTPLEYSVKRRMAAHEVAFKKDGYKTQYITLKKSITTAGFFNCTSWLSWGTDALTGKLFEYSPNSYFIDLENHQTGLNQNTEATLYLVSNYQQTVNDFARQGGEFSRAYAKLLGVEHSDLVNHVKKEFQSLIQENDPIKFHQYSSGIRKI